MLCFNGAAKAQTAAGAASQSGWYLSPAVGWENLRVLKSREQLPQELFAKNLASLLAQQNLNSPLAVVESASKDTRPKLLNEAKKAFKPPSEVKGSPVDPPPEVKSPLKLPASEVISTNDVLNSPLSLSLTAGYQFNGRDGDWLPRYRLGLCYAFTGGFDTQSTITANLIDTEPGITVGKQISLITSHTFLAIAELDLLTLRRLSTYLHVGIGENLTTQQKASQDITRKQGTAGAEYANPVSAEITTSRFTYELGYGLSFALNSKVSLYTTILDHYVAKTPHRLEWRTGIQCLF